jgi:hypothetical protein
VDSDSKYSQNAGGVCTFFFSGEELHHGGKMNEIWLATHTIQQYPIQQKQEYRMVSISGKNLEQVSQKRLQALKNLASKALVWCQYANTFLSRFIIHSHKSITGCTYLV